MSFALEDAETLSLTDVETGSTWEGLAGLGTQAPLTGKRLAPLKSTRSFWFGWKDWFPETGVYGSDD
jgi:hypothetical protein